MDDRQLYPRSGTCSHRRIVCCHSINFFPFKFPLQIPLLLPTFKVLLTLNGPFSKTVALQNLRFPWGWEYKKYIIFFLLPEVSFPKSATIDSEFDEKIKKNYLLQIGGPHLYSPLPPSLECRLRGAESPQSSHPYRFHPLGDSTYLWT